MAVNSEQPIIIKKIKKGGGHGHHGGAWKVAYADFVTAMMAFFLLMWLLNTTSPEQKQGIADYFAPASISSTTSGSGGILGGTSLGDDGAKADGKLSVIQADGARGPRQCRSKEASVQQERPTSTRPTIRPCATPWPRKTKTAFASAAQSLAPVAAGHARAGRAVEADPDRPDPGRPAHPAGRPGGALDVPGELQGPRTIARKILLRAVAKVINQLPNRVTIAGHTSANAYGKKQDGDWSPVGASAPTPPARCCAASGVPMTTGSIRSRARPIPSRSIADDPTLAGNRRISIVLLREKARSARRTCDGWPRAGLA